MVCDLLPVSIVTDVFFANQKALIVAAEEKIAEGEAALSELLEEEAEHYLESSNFTNDTINDGNVKKRIKELKGQAAAKEEINVLEKYLQLKEDIADGKTGAESLEIRLAD